MIQIEQIIRGLRNDEIGLHVAAALTDLAVPDPIEFGGGQSDFLGSACRKIIFYKDSLRPEWVKVAQQCVEETLVADDYDYLVRQILYLVGAFYFISRAQKAY